MEIFRIIQENGPNYTKNKNVLSGARSLFQMFPDT